MTLRRLCGALVLTGLVQASLDAQPAPAAGQDVAESTSIASQPSGDSATLTFFNRPIVVLRARVLGRGPATRAANAAQVLDELVSLDETGAVTSQSISGGVLVLVGSRVVLGLAPADIDGLSGETLEGVTTQAVARLGAALEEARGSRTPGAVLRSVALALAALVIGFFALWGIARSRRAVTGRLVDLSA
jgi:hypothetical protein